MEAPINAAVAEMSEESIASAASDASGCCWTPIIGFQQKAIALAEFLVGWSRRMLVLAVNRTDLPFRIGVGVEQ